MDINNINEAFSREDFEKEKIEILKNTHIDWKDFLEKELEKDYFFNIYSSLHNEINIKKEVVYPSKENWFNALTIPINNLKVIIIGQDPYHGENQAHGFSFSVLPGIKTPPSLKNMYKEIEQEYNIKLDMSNGYLMPWVEQGVMLLNSILTVKAKTPASHKDYGWDIFTDNLIKYISENLKNKVFLLWGSFSKSKAILIDKKKHKILESAHPSPFSAHNGFFGNKHFLLTNEYLEQHGNKKIIWEYKRQIL